MLFDRFEILKLGSRIAAAMVAACAVGMTSPAPAQIISNGGFEGSGSTYTLTNVNAPAGWTYATGNPSNGGCIIVNNSYSGCSYSTTSPTGTVPNGKNFLAIDINNGTGVVGGTISQTLAGLTANTWYSLYFYAAQTGGNFNWVISLGGTPLATVAIASTSWALQTVNFKTGAGVTGGLLSFAATNTSGAPPVAFLDGVKIPEPASLAALGLGALAMAGLRRRRARAALAD